MLCESCSHRKGKLHQNGIMLIISPLNALMDDHIEETERLKMDAVNPIWTGLFANLNRLRGGGGAKWPPPNLAISSQMTMKRGKDILWVEIFTN